MNAPKPIETCYRGYRFRSRLEARWAVFFDALGIRWEYEPEGFEFSDRTRYLPDFWLPTFEGGMYVEVKPEGGDFAKAFQLARESGTKVWLADGTPGLRVYRVLELNESTGALEEYVGIPNADQAIDENRMYVNPGYEERDGSIPEPLARQYLGSWYLEAVRRARSARFEYGERPC